MAACFVCVRQRMCLSVCQTNLVYTSCVIHICLTQRRIGFICGMLMPYNIQGRILGGHLRGTKKIRKRKEEREREREKKKKGGKKWGTKRRKYRLVNLYNERDTIQRRI